MLDRLVIVLLLVALVSFLSTVQLMAHFVTHPNCCVDDLPSRAKNKAWESLTSPIDVGVPQAKFQAVTFPATDGAEANGWIIAERPPKNKSKPMQGKMAVLVHDSGNDKRQMLELAGAINKKVGWAVLLFDTRETEVSQFGRAAVLDVLGALNYVKSREHKYASTVNKVAVVGVSVGAAAGMYAAIKDPAVDAFVPISMPTTAHQYWQAALQRAVTELQETVKNRVASEKPVTIQARFAALQADHLYTPKAAPQHRQHSQEEQTFMARLASSSKGWFIDFMAHLTVMYGAGYRAWLQECADPHKAIHRLQPRGLLLVHGKEDTTTPMWLAQQIYNRAGACSPKLAVIQQ